MGLLACEPTTLKTMSSCALVNAVNKSDSEVADSWIGVLYLGLTTHGIGDIWSFSPINSCDAAKKDGSSRRGCVRGASSSESAAFRSMGSSSDSASSTLGRLAECVLLLGPDGAPPEVRFPRLDPAFALVANVANNSPSRRRWRLWPCDLWPPVSTFLSWG